MTRDPDWWPTPAKPGLARLGLDSDVPVVPWAQWGDVASLPSSGPDLAAA